MPTPNIMIDQGGSEDDEENERPRTRPPPLISMPKLNINISDDESSDESSSDQEDMMTAEEEAAARRYLSGNNEQDNRRMSSLDVYLAQPKTGAESMIINRRLSLREEQEAIEKLNAEVGEEEGEKARKEKLIQEREAVKREREAKVEMKRAGSANSPSPSPRRLNFHKKGFGGLSKERRKKLKEIIMRKARDELQAERLKELHAREAHLKSVLPPYQVDGMDEKQLQELLKRWHHQAKELESQRIEMEERLRKQDEEIQELTSRLIDIKGKYPLPILRKVPKKQNMLARLEKLRAINALHVIKPNAILKPVAKPTDQNTELANGTNENPN